MSTTDDLLINAERYAADFSNEGLASPPLKKVAVVACMDARLIPTRILGLEEGEAHVIRNAGGVVDEDTIRSLAISQNLLGTEEIILIHHTDCGLLTFTDDELADRLERETGVRPSWRAHAFSDLEDDVRESIATLRNDPHIPNKGSIRGFVYDVDTGGLTEVA